MPLNIRLASLTPGTYEIRYADGTTKPLVVSDLTLSQLKSLLDTRRSAVSATGSPMRGIRWIKP